MIIDWCDLYCGGGGAAKGLLNTNGKVTGVDIDPVCKRFYPGRFVQYDITKIKSLHELDGSRFIDTFDAYWASCPCQGNSQMTLIKGKKENHPDFIAPTRKMLERLNKPYVIENVPNAPLHNPIKLCGLMVGLNLLRLRWFECNFPVVQPPCEHNFHCKNKECVSRQPYPVVGRLVSTKRNGGNLRYEDMKYCWPIEMGIDWIPLNITMQDGQNLFSQAIPPLFSQYIAEQLIIALS